MRNWKEVPVPERMANLKRDKRGLPVPFIIKYDKFGQPHFKLNDNILVTRCHKLKLCGICGDSLGDDMWLVGGPLSAFHPQGVYIDSPMHKECVTYALQVCPYLAVSTYNSKTDEDTFKMDDFDLKSFHNPTQSKDRVPYFVLVRTSGFSVRWQSFVDRFIIPVKPYLEVEYWKDGKQIEKPDDN